jgi:transcription elongation factor GreA
MADKYPMTPQGFERMKEELKQLKNVERPKISAEIGRAIELGDLSENAEYHAAKERQGFIEGRIKDLEIKVGLAEVIDPKKLSGDRVVFGATVTVTDLDTDEEITYQIVGDDEADIKANKISISSPIARSLIGKVTGDETKLRSPKGERTLEVSKVKFV